MIAYALRASYAEDFVGGVLTVSGEGATLDVGAALKEGDGVILVEESDYFLTNKLDEYAPLKRVTVPDKDAEPTVEPLEAMTMTALRDMAESLGIEKPGRFNKDDLVVAVRAAQNPNREA